MLLFVLVFLLKFEHLGLGAYLLHDLFAETFGVEREIAFLDPRVITGFFGEHFAERLSLVFAEGEHLVSKCVVADASGQVGCFLQGGVLLQRFYRRGYVAVFLQLRQQHFTRGLGVGVSPVCTN